MNRRMTRGAALVFAIGAVGIACGKRTEPTETRARGPAPAESEQVGTTQTTGATMAADKDKQEQAVRDARDEGMKAGKAECEDAYNAAAAKRAEARAKPKAKTAEKAKSEKAKQEEKTGTTTTTGAEMPSSNPAPAPERNTSTPLGDSSSGTYTGGQGTYGGKATWGTGGAQKK